MAKVNKSATVYASAHTEGQNPKMIYCITGFGVGNHFSSRNVRATFTNRFSVYVCLARKFVCVCVDFLLLLFRCSFRFDSVRRICAWIVKSCAFCHENAMGIGNKCRVRTHVRLMSAFKKYEKNESSWDFFKKKKTKLQMQWMDGGQIVKLFNSFAIKLH